MIVEASSIAADSTIETDVCIVGAGTAGVVLARELIGCPFRVCLIESGGREPDPRTQSLCNGDNIGYPYFPLDTARTRYLGGSSTRWNIPIGNERLGVRLRPFDEIDFERRAWVRYSGWPFAKKELDTYYARAQDVFRIGPPTYEVEDWEDPKSRPALKLPGDEVQTVIYKFGCRDPLVGEYVNEIDRSPNITTLLHANTLEIETNSTGNNVTQLRLAVIGGKEFFLKARVFVLAVGGIETPRLLLLSNRVQKAGLGNQHDLVGRFFMEHPHFWSGIMVPPDPEVFERTALYNGIHTVNGVAIVGKLALTEKVIRREKLLNQNVQLIPYKMPDPFQYRGARPASVESFRALCSAALGKQKLKDAGKHVKNVLTGLDEVAAASARKVRNRVAGVPEIPVYYFAQMMEQVPTPESRITLGDERDLFGQRRLQLNWRMTSQDMRSAMRTHLLVAAALERAGLGRFFREMHDESPPCNTEGGYHHMGTTRMHPDPKQGVVDAHCQVHGMTNLMIAGASVFPTGGYANPVLTTLALTIRLADRIKNLMA